MKKHTLFVLGLLFLSQWVQAQVADSTLRNLASQKMKVFSSLLEKMAAPGLDIATRGQIERAMEVDFFDNREVYLFNDFNNAFAGSQQVSATSYFAQLKALYPNGARLKSSEFEVSEIFYNEPRDMFYMVFRCQRDFKGYNVLAKKEIIISKVIDYQVKLMEGGNLSIDIVSGWPAEGTLNMPMGLDRPISEIPEKQLTYQGSIVPEEYRIEEGKKLLDQAKAMITRYEKMEEVLMDRVETKGEKKQRKIREKAEKARLKRELEKAKAERKSLTTNRINIRVGFGYFESDSSVNNMPSRIGNTKWKSWTAKADVQYKFTGVTRLPDGKWQKAHTIGLFMNYGKQSGSNINHMTRVNREGPSLDTTKPSRGFFEAELGIMLREEFRISGGMGFMNYDVHRDGVHSRAQKKYFSCTAGLSPRLFSFLEMDLNVTGLLIDGAIRPRANMNLVLLLKARKR
jgi:hypothetical protein